MLSHAPGANPTRSRKIVTWLGITFITLYTLWCALHLGYTIHEVRDLSTQPKNQLRRELTFNGTQVGVITSEYWFHNTNFALDHCTKENDFTWLLLVLGSVSIISFLGFGTIFVVHLANSLRSRHQRCGPGWHTASLYGFLFFMLGIIGPAGYLLLSGSLKMYDRPMYHEFQAVTTPTNLTWGLIDECEMRSIVLNGTRFGIPCDPEQFPLMVLTPERDVWPECPVNWEFSSLSGMAHYCCVDQGQVLNEWPEANSELSRRMKRLSLSIGWYILVILAYLRFQRWESRDRTA